MGNRSPVALTLLQAVLAERFITIVTRVFADGPMLYILYQDTSIWGIVTAFVVVTPIYLLMCIGIVAGNDYLLRKWNVDFVGLDKLREVEHEPLERRQWFKRMLKSVLLSKKLIFWVGSWLYLDPDYVTFLLRKKNEGYVSVFVRITLPSVLLSMVVWSVTWYYAVLGYRWAAWLLEWVL